MKEKILKYITEEFGDKSMEIDYDTPLFESGLLDSFSIMMLFIFIQRQFKIELTFEEINKFGTINELVNRIEILRHEYQLQHN